MIYNFTINNLLYPTFFIFLIGFTTITFYLKSVKIAFFVSTIKAFIFFIYFFYFFDTNFRYTFFDDITYITTANEYVNNGKTFFNLISNPLNLVAVFGHFHFLYYLYNILAIEIFGHYYFAPVAMNIIVTFFTAIVLYKLLFKLQLNNSIIMFITIFYLLNWDMLAWSIINFKDFLVQFITISLFYLIIKNDIKFNLMNIIFITILVINVIFLRFYIPFFILLAYFVFKIFLKYKYAKKANKNLYLLLIFLFPIIVSIILKLFFTSDLDLFISHFSNPIIGIIRFILTPLPFHMANGYNFLLFPSLIDFLLLPLFFYGIYLFYKIKSKYKYLILIYFFIVIIFYGSFPELAGPRHKIQIFSFIILFQGLGIIKIIKQIVGKKYNAKNNIFN